MRVWIANSHKTIRKVQLVYCSVEEDKLWRSGSLLVRLNSSTVTFVSKSILQQGTFLSTTRLLKWYCMHHSNILFNNNFIVHWKTTNSSWWFNLKFWCCCSFLLHLRKLWKSYLYRSLSQTDYKYFMISYSWHVKIVWAARAWQTLKTDNTLVCI